VDTFASCYGPVAGFCELGNEFSGSIKGRKFIDRLRNCQFFNKDCTLWSYLKYCSQCRILVHVYKKEGRVGLEM
jgi:hypothetical protein